MIKVVASVFFFNLNVMQVGKGIKASTTSEDQASNLE